ncbi:hypothetical protein [Methylorubrum extorquens]|uniref:Uncharacterized protein n=1 Tax=Methylorubrum extorquens (strain ATCC 14718 / DSM 1338 / JCM 2805 / NCIMB 9133 / AM1) TaxID=272630 RepID=C5B6U8_METEA|nr:hypothetical protein [Methylorubrum extorquens]ACS44180.1 hypothetical protein MexAM1_p3METApCDS5359D [Methylorubrum extorquens AM1]MCP1592001.1 hypothetical protein [Methylorubrum extorquens]
MSDDLAEPVTLFLGPDMDKMAFRRDSIYFPEMKQALKYAVEVMPADRQYGSSIRMERDHSELQWPAIYERYQALQSG